MIELSYSKMSTWFRCRYQYHLRFERELVPRIEAPQLRRGTLIHKGIEAGLRTQLLNEDVLAAINDKIASMFSEWADHPKISPILEETPEVWDSAISERDQCKEIVDRVFLRLGIYDGRWQTESINGTPLIEYKMVEHLETGGHQVKFSGTLDWAARDLSNGHLWLIDWKSRKQMVPDEQDETNLQAGVYQHLLSRYGLILHGTASGQIRAAVPKVPKINKTNPRMSRGSIATDWPTYSVACLAAGLDPNDYLDMREKLSDFERLSLTYRTSTEVQAMWQDLLIAMHNMIDTQLSMKVCRSMSTFNCRGCAYRDMCLGELRGDDVATIEKLLFMRADEAPESWIYGLSKGDEDDDNPNPSSVGN